MFCARLCGKGTEKEVAQGHLIPLIIMKININQILPGGLNLEEEIDPALLDLDTDIVKFRQPLKVKATVSKITDEVIVELVLNIPMFLVCSRCLAEFEVDLKKKLLLNYPVNKMEPIIDLEPDIRQEIILNYPIKPLCKPDCKGLCPKCGKNLNEGGCSCGITEKKTL